jgi:heptosyltransferase-2
MRHLWKRARLNHARSAHATDAAAIVAAGIGLFALLGLPQFAFALLPGVAIYWLVPLGFDAVLRAPAGSIRPARALLLRALAMHGAHVLGIAWLLAWAGARSGVGPVIAVLVLAAAVYEVPRYLLPLAVGRPVDLAGRRLRHVLLQRSDVVGDVVMATPCIDAIKTTSPECRVSVLCRQSTSELLAGHEQLDAVILDPTATGQRQSEGWKAFAIGSLVARLRHREIDALVSLWDRPSSVYAVAALLAGIPVRSGRASYWGGWLLNAGIDPAGWALHEVDRNLQRVRALGFDSKTTPRLSIALQPGDVERARSLLAARHVDPREMLVALSPATSGTNRRLDPACCAQFVRRIHQTHGARALLLGGPADRELTGAIVAGAPPGTIDLAGETSIGLAAAVIARCRIHVGGDSGPTHIAAALGVPCVVISPAKSQKPLHWGPWMVPHRVVRKRSGCALRCAASACRETFCVSAITVDDLCEAFAAVAAGDGVIEPLAGRRYWAALSLSVLVHAPDASRDGEVMRALRLFREAGFIEYVLACGPGTRLADRARAEGHDTRAANAATLLDTFVELDGGIVHDFGAVVARDLRKAMWLARRVGVDPRRIVAAAVPATAEELTDQLLAAGGAGSTDAIRTW